MTLRSILLGIILGFSLMAFEIFKGKITPVSFIGSQLPAGIFGIIVLLLLIWNPIIRGWSKGWVLQKTEIAVIVALALAVCPWPSFMRTFTTTLAMPTHLLKSHVSWQTAQVMSYVPGASPQLADGFVRKWPEFIAKIGRAPSKTLPSPERRVFDCLPEETQRLFASFAAQSAPDSAQRTNLLKGLNAALGRADLYDPVAFAKVPLSVEDKALLNRIKALPPAEVQRVNRRLFDASFPDDITPQPVGHGDLLADGESDPVALDLLIQGSDRKLGLLDLPWATWWPSLRLWGGMALLFSIASVCLAMIVHPQWSKRELLPYPVARFVQEITQPAPNSGWPLVATSKLFWLGFWVIVIIRVLEWLNNWFATGIDIPLQYNFWALNQLFPDAAKVPGSDSVFNPHIIPGVVAFAFFLTTEVSFSLGIMGFLYLGIAGAMIANGISVSSQGIETSGFNLMIFGAYLANTALILYIGRSYYLQVVGSMVGRKHSEAPDSVRWAARGLLLCVILIIVLLNCAGLDWLMSTLFVVLVLIIFFTVGRIYAETGALMAHAAWGPTILLAIFGVEATGPTTYMLLSIAATLMIVSNTEIWMGYLVNAFKISDTVGETAPRRIAPLVLVMTVAGLVFALGAKFLSQYNSGFDQRDPWSVEWVPGGTFTTMASIISDLSARDQLSESTALHGLQRLGAISPQPGALTWIALGMALVTACSFARLRLPWWPIHPVLILIWGTWAGYTLAFSFFLGWLVKLSVTSFGGARGYHTVKPLVIGIVAAEVLMPIIWGIIDSIYYSNTGLTAPWYH